jgi:cellulose synthase/poly-beta-1,6-N-acetylglucosamine synthase-like glycosyltransferase
LLAPFADDAVAGTKGAYETDQRSLVARFVQVEYEERYARMARRPTIDFIDTYAAAYRKTVFDAVGGFDERYRLPSTEDQELSFRVAALGRPMLFTPDARVGHVHVDTVAGYARKKAKIGRFKVATLRRHPGKAVTDSHTPVSLKVQLLLAPLVFLGLAVAAWGASSAGSHSLWVVGAGLTPAVLFLLTALPLWARVLRADFAPGVVAPVLILVRATALGVGVGLGLLGELRGGVLANDVAGADEGQT